MNNIDLVKVSSPHLVEIADWVITEDQLVEWAGPNMQFPCDAQTLKQDLFTKNWPAFSLVTADYKLLGFGQYYSRLGHCHLCRLIIAPCYRSKGLAQILIARISEVGIRALGVTSCSLFVYQKNLAAIKAYQKIGFKVGEYPGGDMPDNCVYMIDSLARRSPSIVETLF